MEEKSNATLEKIHEAAMAEFLDKGFQGASLRQIVKNAGVTTGAFYGYFSSKEALFASIVEPHAAALMGRFMEAQTSFSELPEQEQPEHMGLESSQCVNWMVDYICDHREPVKLLLCKAEGTSYTVHPALWPGSRRQPETTAFFLLHSVPCKFPPISENGRKKGRPSDQMKRPDKQRSGKTPHRCSSIQFCLLSDTSHHSTDFSLAIKVGKGIE